MNPTDRPTPSDPEALTLRAEEEKLVRKAVLGLIGMRDFAVGMKAAGKRAGLEEAEKIARTCDETHGSSHAGHSDQGRCIAEAISRAAQGEKEG